MLSLGEDSQSQFKREMSSAVSLASEMVAFSNTNGGHLFIGINDDGSIAGVPAEAKGNLNQLVGNASSELSRPAIFPLTKWFQIDGKDILVIEVPDGKQKPYCDKQGRYWVKAGSDKRAAAPEELLRMFSSVQRLYLDELNTPADIDEIDKGYFTDYLDRFHNASYPKERLDQVQLLNNMKLANDAYLNLAGLLLFGKNPQIHKPYCMVKVVAYEGTEIEDTSYLDRDDIVGNMYDMYETCMSFLKRNLKRVQPSEEFNQQGKLEVSEKALSEAVVNALVHRDYGKSAPILLLVFADRVEIISPGKLPNHLTVENIIAGNTVQRNPTILSFGSRVLPYSGLGSGVKRILAEHPATTFSNDVDGEQFKVLLKRP